MRMSGQHRQRWWAGAVDVAFHHFSAVLVSFPEAIVVAVFALVAVAAWSLAQHAGVYVDTSIDAFYSRQNPIADRYNSEGLNYWALDSHCPRNNLDEAMLQELVANITQRSGNAPSKAVVARSNGVSGQSDGREELHVIVSSQGGNVFGVRHVEEMCALANATRTRMREQGVCGRALPPDWERVRQEDFPFWDSYPCLPEKSLLGLYETMRSMNEPLLDAMLDHIAQLDVTDADVELATRACAMRSPAADLLCSLPRWGGFCDAETCRNEKKCLVGSLDPCILLSNVHPTARELHSLAALPRQRVDANGCDNINMTSLNATLEAAAVLMRWSEASSALPVASLMGYLVDGSFGRGPAPLESRLTRLVFSLRDVHPYRNRTTGLLSGVERSATAFVDHWQRTILPQFQGRAGTRYSFRQWNYFAWYTTRQVMRDVTWAAGAVALLVVYMTVQLGSVFVSVGIVAGILGTLPLSLWIYCFVLGSDWIGVLTFLGIFIILGVGADDVFVIVEHWKFACSEADSDDLVTRETLTRRMASALKHSSSAVTATSFTTMAAFGANFFSPLSPVRLFGSFMVILVFVNWLLVIVLLPSLLVIHHKMSAASPHDTAADDAPEDDLIKGRTSSLWCLPISLLKFKRADGYDQADTDSPKSQGAIRSMSANTMVVLHQTTFQALSALQPSDSSDLAGRAASASCTIELCESAPYQSSPSTPRKSSLQLGAGGAGELWQVDCTPGRPAADLDAPPLRLFPQHSLAALSASSSGSTQNTSSHPSPQPLASSADVSLNGSTRGWRSPAMAPSPFMAEDDCSGSDEIVGERAWPRSGRLPGQRALNLFGAAAHLHREFPADAAPLGEEGGTLGANGPVADEVCASVTSADDSAGGDDRQRTLGFREASVEAPGSKPDNVPLLAELGESPMLAADGDDERTGPERHGPASALSAWRVNAFRPCVWRSTPASSSSVRPEAQSWWARCAGGASASFNRVRRAAIALRGFGTAQEFFATTYTDFIIRWRWAIFAALLAIVACMGVCTSRLQLPHSRPSAWRSSHNINKYYADELQFQYGQAMDQISLWMVFGQVPADHGALNVPYEKGELVLAPGFNLTTEASQAFALSFCQALESEVANSRVVEGTVLCPHLLIDKYLRGISGQGLPIEPWRFEQYLRMYSNMPPPAGRNVQFATPDMLGQEVFDSHTGRLHPSIDPANFGRATWEQKNPHKGWVVGDHAGRTRMLPHPYRNPAAAVPAVLLIDLRLTDTWTIPFVDMTRTHDYWQAWLEAHLADAPPEMAPEHAFQSSDAWKLMDTSRVMYESALTSVALSLALSFAVLLVGTGNLAVAAIATALITSTLVIFTGTMYILGWQIGVMECVCLTVLVGLAVDYVVHAAHGFCYTLGSSSNKEAISFGLRTMAVSIFSAFFTTVGAAAFLLPCEMSIFTVFGLFVIITLSTSYVTAIVAFPALCAVFEPAIRHGNVSAAWRLLRRGLALMCGRSSQAEVQPEATVCAFPEGSQMVHCRHPPGPFAMP